MSIVRRHVLVTDPAGTEIAVFDSGGPGPTVLLLHGLAGSSRELLPTARTLQTHHRVVLVDQRGHGLSTRRPADLSREAFAADVAIVIERHLAGAPVRLVGQSMGAHTAFLAASTRPDLVERLVMLEGHVAGAEQVGEAQELADFFASWPTPFADRAAARAFLGDAPVARAWVEDLEETSDGLRPRFDADVMGGTIAAVHEPRWREWEQLVAPTTVVFAEHGMFTEEAKDALVRARPSTRRIDLPAAGHDAHLDAFDAWIALLTPVLGDETAAR